MSNAHTSAQAPNSFQDTNWDQWTIISAMAEEYFAGQGAAGHAHRTLFTVGDYKQAIFGFQGTGSSPRLASSTPSGPSLRRTQ